MLHGKIFKDSLLINTNGKRLILVGGSNLSFGINSQMIKDSLSYNPINTAIHAGIGLEYMLDNTSKYIQKDDIVLIAPEYAHFTKQNIHGDFPMITTCFEVDKFRLGKKLSTGQLKFIIREAPGYCFEKLNPFNYIYKSNKNDIYGKESFNQFGDAVRHYNLPNELIEISNSYNYLDYNPSSLEVLNGFKIKADAAGATVLISYPSFHSSASIGSQSFINKLDSTLKAHNFNVISNPHNYIMADSLFFNSRYHLNKNGIDIRTANLINDLKNALRTDFKNGELF